MQAKSERRSYLENLIRARTKNGAAVAAGACIGRDHGLGALGGLGRQIVIRSETGEQHSEGEGANNNLHGVLPFRVGSSVSVKGD